MVRWGRRTGPKDLSMIGMIQPPFPRPRRVRRQTDRRRDSFSRDLSYADKRSSNPRLSLSINVPKLYRAGIFSHRLSRHSLIADDYPSPPEVRKPDQAIPALKRYHSFHHPVANAFLRNNKTLLCVRFVDFSIRYFRGHGPKNLCLRLIKNVWR